LSFETALEITGRSEVQMMTRPKQVSIFRRSAAVKEFTSLSMQVTNAQQFDPMSGDTS